MINSCRMILLYTTLILAGCATGVDRYTTSSENARILRAAPKSIALGKFSGDKGSVFCNGGLLLADSSSSGPDNNGAFALYIRQAFEQELVNANINPGLPRLMVSLKLLNVDVSCRPVIFNSFYWALEAEVTVEGKAPYIVKTRMDLASRSFMPTENEIREIARTSFPRATQMLIAGVMTHPTFISALRDRPPQR